MRCVYHLRKGTSVCLFPNPLMTEKRNLGRTTEKLCLFRKNLWVCATMSYLSQPKSQERKTKIMFLRLILSLLPSRSDNDDSTLVYKDVAAAVNWQSDLVSDSGFHEFWRTRSTRNLEPQSSSRTVNIGTHMRIPRPSETSL